VAITAVVLAIPALAMTFDIAILDPGSGIDGGSRHRAGRGTRADPSWPTRSGWRWIASGLLFRQASLHAATPPDLPRPTPS
jgi:hypothetical protein